MTPTPKLQDLLISTERNMATSDHPPASGCLLSGVATSHPATAAVTPKAGPMIHSGARGSRGMRRPNAAPQSPPQKQKSADRGTPNGGIGVRLYGAGEIWPVAYSSTIVP